MSLWLRVRRMKATLAAIGAFAVVSLAAGDVALAMPPLLASYGLSVPVVVLAPLILSTVVGWGLMSGDGRLEQVSSRPIKCYSVREGRSSSSTSLTGTAGTSARYTWKRHPALAGSVFGWPAADLLSTCGATDARGLRTSGSV